MRNLFVYLKKTKSLYIPLILFLFSSSGCTASTFPTTQTLQKLFKGLQISTAFGGSILKINNGSFVVNSLSHEVDTTSVKRSTRQLNTKIGIGYNLFSDKLSQNKFLNNLLIEINFYNFYGSAYGELYQAENPTRNDYKFTLGINSKRFMIDIKPNLFTYHRFSPYLILGAGFSLLDTTFEENNPQNPENPKRFNYPHYVNKKLVIEGGGGLSYAINNHFGISLEYLYTKFGKTCAAQGINVYSGSQSPDRPNFTNIYTNSILFGLYVKI